MEINITHIAQLMYPAQLMPMHSPLLSPSQDRS